MEDSQKCGSFFYKKFFYLNIFLIFVLNKKKDINYGLRKNTY